MTEKLKHATQRHAYGDFSAALDSYQEILERHPNSGRANYNFAVLARQPDKPQLCERYLKRSIECAESVDEAVRRLLELASLLMLGNRFVEADQLIDMAEPYAEGIAEFYEWRGKLKHALERYDDAIAAFEKACELKPKVGSYWVQLADSMTKSDTQHTRADFAIRCAANTNIDDPDILTNISAYYINQSRYADAEPYLRTAFKVAKKQNKPLDAFYCFASAMSCASSAIWMPRTRSTNAVWTHAIPRSKTTPKPYETLPARSGAGSSTRWDAKMRYCECSAPGSLDTSLSHAAGLIEIAACHA